MAVNKLNVYSILHKHGPACGIATLILEKSLVAIYKGKYTWNTFPLVKSSEISFRG